MFIESIQQSPIDLDFSSESPPLMSSNVSEENPLSPPIETPLISLSVGQRMKFWKIKDWIHQLVEPLFNEDRSVTVGRCSDGMSVEVTSRGGSSLRVVGMEVFWNGMHARIHEEDKLEQWVKELYLRGQGLIEQWRSRIVRLSLDTDEVECSLMDDLYPPRTFLAEYKQSMLMKSIRIHDGILYITTVTRTITVPVSLLEDEPDGKVSELLCSAAPELCVVDVDDIYRQFIDLRRMCIDEDKRIFEQEHASRGERTNVSTIDIAVGGG